MKMCVLFIKPTNAHTHTHTQSTRKNTTISIFPIRIGNRIAIIRVYNTQVNSKHALGYKFIADPNNCTLRMIC